jgi:hypothetical protein
MLGTFIVGFITGGMLGFLICGVLTMSKICDEQYDLAKRKRKSRW